MIVDLPYPINGMPKPGELTTITDEAARSSGGMGDHLREAIVMMSAGKLNPAALPTHIGGLNAVADTIKNLSSIPSGKKMICNDLDLELTTIWDFEETGKIGLLLAELDRLCKARNNLWNPEAERYLLANAKKT